MKRIRRRYGIDAVENLNNSYAKEPTAKRTEDFVYDKMGLLMSEYAVFAVAILILEERTPEELGEMFKDVKIKGLSFSL